MEVQKISHICMCLPCYCLTVYKSCIFLKTYYHTKFQNPTSGTSVAPT